MSETTSLVDTPGIAPLASAAAYHLAADKKLWLTMPASLSAGPVLSCPAAGAVV